MLYFTNYNYVGKSPKKLPPTDCATSVLDKWLLEANSCMQIVGDCLVQCKEESQRYMFCIPVEWLDSIGCTEQHLKDWLMLIRFEGVWDFTFRYYGKHDTNFVKGWHQKLCKFTSYDQSLFAYVPDHQGSNSTETYVVGFVSKDHSLDTYLQVIALRYIYNIYYSDIPPLAFKIMENTEATPWEAFILAHMKRKYYSFYSIVSQYKPGTDYDDPQYDNKPLNPFLTITSELKDALREDLEYEGVEMIKAFQRLEAKGIDLSKVRNLLNNQSYEEAYNYVKKSVK